MHAAGQNSFASGPALVFFLHFFFFLIFLQLNLLPFFNLILPDLFLHVEQERLHNDGQLSATSVPSMIFLHFLFLFLSKNLSHFFPLASKPGSSVHVGEEAWKEEGDDVGEEEGDAVWQKSASCPSGSSQTILLTQSILKLVRAFTAVPEQPKVPKEVTPIWTSLNVPSPLLSLTKDGPPNQDYKKVDSYNERLEMIFMICDNLLLAAAFI